MKSRVFQLLSFRFGFLCVMVSWRLVLHGLALVLQTIGWYITRGVVNLGTEVALGKGLGALGYRGGRSHILRLLL